MWDEPYLSEIRLMSFNFPPKGWAFCNGQLMPINANQALFALLGTLYGGNGTTNFGLPDLRGRVPIGVGDGYGMGAGGGIVSHTLSVSELPTHQHHLMGVTGAGQATSPGGAVLAGSPNAYAPAGKSGLVALSPANVTNTGGSQSHENMMPYAVTSFCIAIQGIFPSRD